MPAARRPKATVSTKIGEFRGSPRLWLEGRKLERADILPGSRFDVAWDAANRRVVLTFGDEGERKVSRRRRGEREMPIIDINSRELEDVFGEGLERARVVIEKGRIVVEPHPHDVRTKERFDRLVAAVKAGRPLSTGSLAHGGGVIDHAIHAGLKDAGLEARLAFAVEIDPDKLDAAATNNSVWDADTLQIESPMQEIDFAELPRIDMLVAGLPCVGASRSGKAKNAIGSAEEHPTAGALFYAALRVVEETNPSLVVLENVVDYGREVSAHVIRAKLSEWGYDLYEFTVRGADFGAIEDRTRLCILAVTRQFPIDVSRLMPVEVEKGRTLADILDPVPLDDPAWRDVGHLVDKAARDKEGGKGFKMNWVEGSDETIGTIGAGYYKWRQTEPKIRHPEKPDHARQLTPVEHARAKGIPPELVAGISNTLAHEILGNSVIWPAFRAVGAMVGSQVAAEVGRLPDVAVTVTVEGRRHKALAAAVSSLETVTAKEPKSIRGIAKGLSMMQFQLDLSIKLPEPAEADREPSRAPALA